MATTDEVIDLVQLSRDRIGAITDEQVVALTSAWVDAWSALETEFQDSLVELLSGADDMVAATTVAQNQRVAQALQQARTRLEELADLTEVTVVNDLRGVLLDAANTRYQSLLAQIPHGSEQQLLNQLNPTALEAIVVRSTQQIHAARLPLPAATERLMKAELVRAITVGDNPRVTASRIVNRTEGQFFGGLARAARISRSETLDAMRTADLESARANRNVIESRIWMATLDSRTCVSCLAQHGTEWPVDSFGPEDHVQGRCVFIDKTKSWAELGFQGIEDTGIDLQAQRNAWWNNLDEETQRATLGPGRYELWRNNEIDWSDLSKRVDTPEWRTSYIERPLKELV